MNNKQMIDGLINVDTQNATINPQLGNKYFIK